jgi:hypothetical protein
MASCLIQKRNGFVLAFVALASKPAFNVSLSEMAYVIVFLSCVWEVSGLNFGWDTEYSD